jgi:hypothetical protein
MAPTRSIYDDDPSRVAYHNATEWHATINEVVNYINNVYYPDSSHDSRIHQWNDDRAYYCHDNECACH